MEIHWRREIRGVSLKKAGYVLGAIILVIISQTLLPTEVSYYESPEDLEALTHTHGLEPNPVSWGGYAVSVRVLVLADEEYRLRHHDWRRSAFLTIERTDDAFYRVFGINLVVAEFGEWTWPGNVADSAALIREVERQAGWRENRGDLDILIAFTGRRHIWGCGGFAEQYVGGGEADTVVITSQMDFGNGNVNIHVLQNEISHLFGAVDYTDPSDLGYWREGVMSYLWLYHTHEWSDDSKKIIMANRGRFAD